MRLCLDDEQAFILETDDMIPPDKRKGDHSFYIALLNLKTSVSHLTLAYSGLEEEIAEL